MQFKTYLVPFADLIDRQCFTSENSRCVYYEDTEKGGRRTFHSYLDGQLHNSSVTVNSNGHYYYCDVRGNILDKDLVLDNRKLRNEVKSLKQAEYKAPFDLWECRDTGALIVRIGEPYKSDCSFNKPWVTKGLIVHHTLECDVGKIYEFNVDSLKKVGSADV